LKAFFTKVLEKWSNDFESVDDPRRLASIASF